jgi:hypothetical protein
MKRKAEHDGQPRRELSTQQQAAVELLAAGKTDKQVAESLKLSAASVAKWRRYDPVFQAALNACRAAIWQAAIDRVRAMVPQALDALAEELSRTDNPDRGKIALDILRVVKLPDLVPHGPADPDTIVREAVNREREQARDSFDDILEDIEDLPDYEEHLSRKWTELEAMAADTSASPCQDDTKTQMI